MSSQTYRNEGFMQDSYYGGSPRASGDYTGSSRAFHERGRDPQREHAEPDRWPIMQRYDDYGNSSNGRRGYDDRSNTGNQGGRGYDDQGRRGYDDSRYMDNRGRRENDGSRYMDNRGRRENDDSRYMDNLRRRGHDDTNNRRWIKSGESKGRHDGDEFLDGREDYSRRKFNDEDYTRRVQGNYSYDVDSLDGDASFTEDRYMQRFPHRERFNDEHVSDRQLIHGEEKSGRSKYEVRDDSFDESSRAERIRRSSNQSLLLEFDSTMDYLDREDYYDADHTTDDRDVLVRENLSRRQDDRERFSYGNAAFDAGEEIKPDYDPPDRDLSVQNLDLNIEDGKNTLIRRKIPVKEGPAAREEDATVTPPNRKVKTLPSRRSKYKTLRLRKLELQQIDSIDGVANFYRDQILQESARSLHGVASWQVKKSKAWTQIKQQVKSALYLLEPWAGALKTVEGNFGTAIMSYFRFLRWLLFLNLYMMLIMTCLTMVPFLVLHDSPSTFSQSTAIITNANQNAFVQEALSCTSNYSDYRTKFTNQEDVFSKILDFLQGTGWMENTVLFYGVYYNKTFTIPTTDRDLTYNMGLVYLLATGAVFIISFLLLVRNSGKGLKQEVLDEGGKMSQFCNKIFSGWDFCICNEKPSKEKHRNLFQEFHSDLENQRLLWKKSSRTSKDKAKLYTKRAVINLLVVCLLGASLAAIGFSFFGALDLQKSADYNPIVQFLIQFMPSLVITILNVIMPLLLKKLVILEDYMPAFEIKMTLLRTVMLRLSSLLTMMFALYIIVNNRCENLGKDITCNDTRTSWALNPDDKYPYTCGNRKWFGELEVKNGTVKESTRQDQIKCWETYVGQQIYKLVIMDFLVVVIVTFIVEYPRGLIYKKFNGRVKIVDLIGQQEFDLPKAVLDLVYLQTLCWMGVFFSPLIPAICFFKTFILFYVKKGSLMHNCTQPTRAVRTSRSNSMFVGMLLMSFCMVCISLAFIIGNFSPSQSCGPFRVYSTSNFVYYDSVRDLIVTFPSSAQEGLYVFGTLKFFIPALLVLCFVMYYYCALSTGYTKKANLLREELILEGKDKQYLLARVNDAWQHIESTHG